MNRNGFRRDERGYIAALAIMVLAVLMLLGSGAATLATRYRELAAHQHRQAQAYYIAEAGVEMVLSDPAFLSRLAVDAAGGLDDDYRDAVPYLSNVPFAGGSLSVSATRKPDREGLGVFRIYSTGRVGSDARVLKTEVRIALLNFDCGIQAGGNVTVAEETVTTGDIRSNGRVTIQEGATVTGDILADGKVDLHKAVLAGDIKAGGDVSIHQSQVTGGVDTEGTLFVNPDTGPGGEQGQGGGVTGDVRANGAVRVRHGCGGQNVYSPELDLKDADITGQWYRVNPGVAVDVPGMPGPDLDYFRRTADEVYPETPTPGYSKTFTTQELTGISGIHFVDGDAGIGGVYSGRAAIVCTGNMTVGSLSPSGEGDVLALLTGQEIRVGDGCDAAALFCALGEVIIGNDSRVSGAIIAAGDVTLGQRSRFAYEEEMTKHPPPGAGGQTFIITWQEKYPAF